LPDIPTIGNFVSGFEASGWAGLGSPRNTPAQIIENLNTQINAGLADAKIRASIADLGSARFSTSPDEFEKFIAAETEKWAKVVKFSGAKPE
jgi:tripartite-type tricarboxylate transporter receptor subunit TctC